MTVSRKVQPSKTATSLITMNPAQNSKREEMGVQLLTPLEEATTSLSVTDAQSYEDADLILGRIQQARKKWNIEWYGDDGKSGPIPKSREVLDQLYAIIRKVDKPLETMEVAVKKAMKDFKLLELKATQDAQRETQRLQDELDAARRREELAKTPQMAGRARVAQQDLIEKITVVEETAVPKAVGFSSSVRALKKWRIKDPIEFLTAVAEGTIPLDLEQDVIITLTADAKKVLDGELKTDPAGLSAWPGIEVYDDINIVGR